MTVFKTVWRGGKGLYGPSPRIVVDETVCNVCGEQRLCIGSETSDGEYGEIRICGPCVERLLRENTP